MRALFTLIYNFRIRLQQKAAAARKEAEAKEAERAAERVAEIPKVASPRVTLPLSALKQRLTIHKDTSTEKDKPEPVKHVSNLGFARRLVCGAEICQPVFVAANSSSDKLL